ncbi:MAG: sigma-70 family RNA polymerase sigma factor [Planctomycetes bacterium]|nr:sigma-70 family RNA polymerase sigma factor [Planctomycetota bacterium]
MGIDQSERQISQLGRKKHLPKSPTQHTINGGQNDSIEALLARMQEDDRDAAAIFVMRYGSKIRRRIRGKLSPAMRRVFDSLDILSTVGRRLDSYVRAGKLKVTNEAQLWALVLRMANNAVIDKSRIFRRLQKVEAEDSDFSQMLLKRLRNADQRGSDGVGIEIADAISLLKDDTNKQILTFWISGSSLNEIAEYVGMAPTAVRKRWQTIRSRLSQSLRPENS